MSDTKHFDSEGVVHEKGRHGEAFNAEPSIPNLTSQGVTSQEQLFRRNHDDIVYAEPDVPVTKEEWTLDVIVDADVAQEQGWKEWTTGTKGSEFSQDDGDDDATIARSKAENISLSKLKSSYPNRSVLSAMECAGNRRSEMEARKSNPASVEGLQWKQGAIGNAQWQGASLREVLLSLGVADPYYHLTTEESARLPPTVDSMQTRSAPWSRHLFVHFLSSQPSSESTKPQGQVYGSSIPLSTAMHPNQDVLLCWSVNNVDLGPAHGYPLRAVIPGHVAARWVKWLSGIRVSKRENDSPAMRDDYKILTPPKEVRERGEEEKWAESVTGEKQDPDKRMKELHALPAMMRLGVGAGVGEPVEKDGGTVVSVDGEGMWNAEGYAVGTEGSPVTIVELVILPYSGEDDDESSSLKSLRQAASQVPREKWSRLLLDSSEREGDNVVDGHIQIGDPAAAEASSSRFSWSWSLWEARLPAPRSRDDGEKGKEEWALVVRCTTEAGVVQEMQSPWNVRGFRERSWPVVRGLRFEKAG